jgi:two-component system cell cycle sensor histidine kinase/response regulator CckA
VPPTALPHSRRSCSHLAGDKFCKRALPSSIDSSKAFDLDPGAYPVRVDPAQIEHVIVNLVVNAADATPPGGRIAVRTGNAHELALDELPPGRYATLSVEDSGPGIDESAIEHLFEPFFTTKSVGRGVGLGLATAYGIAKQSGGTISVTSAAGAGSTFTLYLPEACRSSSAETILVIESNPAVRDVLFELLSESGYRAVTASTPTEALRVAERIDDGIDLVLTELDERRAHALARSLGCAKALTLQKPYPSERLREAVKRALDG